MKPKYLVIDNYDLDFYELGRVNTLTEVRKIARDYAKDTDGECYVLYLTLNETSNRYSRKTATLVVL